MFVFKKKNYSYLYIFFLILVFFFNEFSTNNVFSKNYNVSDIKVEEVYDINFDKSKVVDKAFIEAFKILFYRLIENKDKSKINIISLKDKKSLIENFSINDEIFVDNKYIALFNVQFNKRKILNYLNKKNIIPSSPNEIRAFMLPLLIDTNLNELFYLLHKYLVQGVHTPFGGEGFWKSFYYTMLITHIILAIIILPLILRTLFLAIKGKKKRHKAWARWTFPIWYYVSVTGVLVYFFIYQWF